MKITKYYALVKVKIAKDTRISETIVAADNYVDMKYNNQKGELVQIGEKTSKLFPAAKVGDTIIFHHAIEDEEWRVCQEDAEHEYRAIVLTADEVYGIERDGIIIPHPDHIWCVKEEKPKAGWDKKNGIILSNKEFETADDIHTRISELDTEVKYKSQGKIVHQGVIQRIKNESEELTQMLNKKIIHKLKIAAVNREEFPYMKAGDTLYYNGFIDFFGYPLKYKGIEYLIIRNIFFQAFKSN